MAINPSTDIVLGVLQAADPSKVSAVERRLAALASSPSSVPAAAFDRLVARAQARAVPSTPSEQPGIDRAAKVAQNFEAVLLNSFVTEMLPKENAGYFGQGVAGDAWKSLLSDQISRQIARSGELGIARRLFQSHPILSSSSAPTTSAAPLSSASETQQSRSNP